MIIEETVWRCTLCGYAVRAVATTPKNIPQTCPACNNGKPAVYGAKPADTDPDNPLHHPNTEDKPR